MPRSGLKDKEWTSLHVDVGPGERSPRVTFRIPAQTRHLLEQRARDQGRPVADVLREAVEQYLR